MKSEEFCVVLTTMDSGENLRCAFFWPHVAVSAVSAGYRRKAEALVDFASWRFFSHPLQNLEKFISVSLATHCI